MIPDDYENSRNCLVLTDREGAVYVVAESMDIMKKSIALTWPDAVITAIDDDTWQIETEQGVFLKLTDVCFFQCAESII